MPDYIPGNPVVDMSNHPELVSKTMKAVSLISIRMSFSEGRDMKYAILFAVHAMGVIGYMLSINPTDQLRDTFADCVRSSIKEIYGLNAQFVKKDAFRYRDAKRT